MMREYQVRICERLGVKFPGPTRQPPRLTSAITYGLPRETDVVRPTMQVRFGHKETQWQTAREHLVRFAPRVYLVGRPEKRQYS
jgi:hypothetical protein